VEWASLREDYILRKEYYIISHVDDDAMDVGAMQPLEAGKDVPLAFWERKDIDSMVELGKALLTGGGAQQMSL
jgi:hypothetical protein